MSVSINYNGRLGNHLFQYVAAFIFAKKFNLSLNTIFFDDKFKFPQLNGSVHVDNKLIVNDSNFLELLNSETIEPRHYIFDGFFQIKDFVLNYKNEIKSLFDLSYDEINKNEVFVMYRIGDIEGIRQMLPIEYYQDALNKISSKSGYITSDSPNHPNVIKLSKEFNLTIYNNTPSETINFAKNFNNLVLSEGSFSWWIGTLSNSKNVYYNQRERFWHGDIFVFPEWIPLYYDWDSECITSNNRIICNKIKNDITNNII
jgi:hypothetical protein